MRKDSVTAMETMPIEQRNCLVKKTRGRWGSTVIMSFEGGWNSWEEWDGTCGSCGASVSTKLGVEAVEG